MAGSRLVKQQLNSLLSGRAKKQDSRKNKKGKASKDRPKKGKSSVPPTVLEEVNLAYYLRTKACSSPAQDLLAKLHPAGKKK